MPTETTTETTVEVDSRRFTWLAKNLEDIQKITMAVIFIAGLGYGGLTFLGKHFVTKAEAADYALKENVKTIDHNLAKTQSIVLGNELYNARKLGIQPEDKTYLRSIDKRVFMLKIKLKIIDSKEKDYKTPKYLKE